MADFLMPRLSDSMEEGTVVRWLVADGDEVVAGQVVVEIETDKATMEYEADAAGPIRFLVAEGDEAAVGAPIATIGGAAPPAAVVAEREPVAVAEPAAGAAEPVAAASPSVTELVAAPDPGGRPPGASPIARRIAADLGIDLGAVTGSGPRGRILKADVTGFAADGGGATSALVPAAAAPAVPAPAKPAVATPAVESAKGAVEVVELTRTQATIARRMAESRATIPEFSVTAEVDMTAATLLRAELKRELERPPTLNDMLVRAVGSTLRKHPRLNGCYADGRFELYERVNVGVAVAAADALLVPTVFDADRRPLGLIAERTRELATKAREGTITPPELAGGTFTISNLGMFGIDSFEGVINPGQAAILCAGGMAAKPRVLESGEIEARQVMRLTLVCDHRIVYGADAAAFLSDLRGALEQPVLILV